MKLVITAALLAVTASRSPAQRVTLRGTVELPNGPAANAVVYLESEEIAAVPVSDTVLVDQKSLRFIPDVLAITPGSTVVFGNSDVVMHNVFSPVRGGSGFNLGTYSQKDTRSHTFGREGVNVILCHVHPEMVAYIVVVPSRYRVIVGGVGNFELTGIPAGTYMLKIWHRRAQPYSTKVTLTGPSQNISVKLQRP